MKTVILILFLVFTVNAQQIVNLSHFQPHYNVDKKEISLSGGNPNVLKQFLHELGHHIWFYGGVDTTEFKKRFYMFDNIPELFANEHYEYFVDKTCFPYSEALFDRFYNR